MEKHADNSSSKNGKKLNDEKQKKLIDYLETLQETGFTGYIKINYSQGAVGRIEKFEEILKK